MADVLIADDDGFSRRLLRASLEGPHEVVGEAETGVEAVELSRSREPAVVVLEVSLPIKDGIEATEALAEDGEFGVVVCSAERDRETVADAMAAGADGFVAKPFQREGLLEAVDDALGG